MPYLRQGSLYGYLRAHSDSVDSGRRLRWLQEAAHITRRVHERRVLVADSAIRNFLLDDNLSLQMRDFTKSVIVSNDEDMANFVSEDCLLIKFDIARFGSMIYEVTSGSRYEFYVIPEIEADLDDDPESKTFKAWPTAEKLPNTNSVFLGDVIRRCWAGDGFLTMQEVCHALDNADQRAGCLCTRRHSLASSRLVVSPTVFRPEMKRYEISRIKEMDLQAVRELLVEIV